MVAITVAPRREDPSSDIESVVSGSWFQIRLSAAVSSGGQWILPIWSDVIPINGSPVEVQLDPQATIPYEARFHLDDGNGDFLDFTEFRKVVDATPRAWDTLESTGAPGTITPVSSDIQSQFDAINARIDAISASGASTLGTITDMSPYARTLNVATSATAARTTLGAPAVGDAPAAHTHVATTDLTATGTKSATTFLRGDNTWNVPAASSVAWGAITGTPTTFPPTLPIASSGVTGLDTTIATTPWLLFTSGGNYPARPATSRSVWFMDPAVQPTNDGLLAGGGGMYPLLDIWLSG